MEKKHILIGCTGSVASKYIPEIILGLKNIADDDIEIQLLPTQNSKHFFKVEDLPITVWDDADEWRSWQKMNDPVIHIELRRWADILVIAPLGANTMAKIATGICDNLLTCVVRAWDVKKPLYFAPAMNTHMWNHPITGEQVLKLKSFGYKEIPCILKKLACGDKGFGGMAEVSSIVECIKGALKEIREQETKTS
ncbi:phosphopantothenoylcysteine decarboxylase-like [Lineus longissimus]|uniref:phosphopantothenoylcysteine decarboxylase-like n=1 Tax=Lineus longissimus TaxID=88925 RepID=UPI002B4DC38A